MKVPKWVRVGPVWWKIKVTKSGYACKKSCYYGETDLIRGVIRLNPDQADDIMASTLMHELLHCCFAQTSWEFDKNAKREEALIRALEPVLTDMLRRPENAQLRNYLFGE